MPVKVKIVKNKLLNRLKEEFSFTPGQVFEFIRQFHSQMDRGLEGKKSSLEMLLAFVDCPSGKETGKFIALDLGGTNFRLLELQLQANNKIRKLKEQKFVLTKQLTKGKGKALFDFIAGCVADFVKKDQAHSAGKISIGFTFSFPVKQDNIDSGRLICWTKGFSASGVVGRDVVSLLNASLADKQINNIRVAALANDTVGTLVSCAYQDRNCDIGVILGTGTNACYREKVSCIKKYKGPGTESGHMIINTEWGNFNKVRTNIYDQILDKDSQNPGCQILEKMISGMYLGEIARLVTLDLIKAGILSGGKIPSELRSQYSFKTEYMSYIESDHTAGLTRAASLLKRIGIEYSSLTERKIVKKICSLISCRAAVLSAASLAAIISKIDPALSSSHTIAVDGTVYEKYPGFAKNMRVYLKQALRGKINKIKITLTKDGSGMGAAIIAAVAEINKEGLYA